MSTGKPTFECTNGCTTPVAHRGMCPACAAERRAAQIWVRDETARIRVACGVELPQHVELLSPLPVMPVAAQQSVQEPREVRKAAPDMAGPPVSAKERLGLNTLLTPPPPPKHSPDMSRSARVRLAAKAAEARYEAIKAWIPQDRIWTEGEAVMAAGGCSKNVVRDTLRKMAAEGLIRVIHCRGWAAASWVEPQTTAGAALAYLRAHGPQQVGDLARALDVGVEALRKALHNSGKTRIEDGRVTLRGGV